MNDLAEWTPEEETILQENRRVMTISQLYEELRHKGYERSPKAIEHKCLRLGLHREGQDELIQEDPTDTKPIYEALARLRQMGRDYTQSNKGLLKTGMPSLATGLRKILVTGDWHIPFEKEEMIMDMITEHGDADAIFITGDLLDLYAVSVFTKNQHLPLLKEYQIAREWLEILSQMFPKVVLMDGNHEGRLQKYFAKNASHEVYPFVSQPILQRLAMGFIYGDEGLVSAEPFENVIYQPTQSWYVHVGKTIFVHPESYYGDTASGRVLGTSVKADNYFRTKLDYDCIVCAHTHKAGWAIRDGVMIMEHGCACNMLDYQADDKKFRYGMQHNGYAVLYQDMDGNTDFNKSHVVFRGMQWPKKDKIDVWT